MLELALRIGFSLLVVFGLMWGLAKVARRGQLGGHRGTGTLSVLTRQQLARGAAVAVVQVADKALVVGITDQHVTLLGETELEAFQHAAAHPHEKRDHVMLPTDVILPSGGKLDGSALSPRTWRQAMDFLRDRTSRR